VKPAVPTIVICAALIAVGCGQSGNTSSSPVESTGGTTVGAKRPHSGSVSEKPKPHGPPRNLVARKSEPRIVPPNAPPPKRKVTVRDLKQGTGAVARTGDVLTVDFKGVFYETGKPLNSSWERGEPFTFRLGGEKGILGWEKSLQGMRVGGRRELIVPARLVSRYLKPPEATSQIYVIDLRALESR
jgi:peptidylprolyl isomerase